MARRAAGYVRMSFFSGLAKAVGSLVPTGFAPQVLQFEDLKVITTALLAEGGYSFVYSAREMSSSARAFAVKKVLTQDEETQEIADTEVVVPPSSPAARLARNPPTDTLERSLAQALSRPSRQRSALLRCACCGS